MKITRTPLKGCVVLESSVFIDARGSFRETYKKDQLDKALGHDVNFVQDNESISIRGVLRGLHFQKGEFAQAKLVRVAQGAVLDVAIDIRPDSVTYGKHYAIELSAENNKQLFIPRGFAHGFVTLSDTAVFSYKCDNYFNKDAEGGILFNDPDLAIDWRLSSAQLILSKKDLQLPHFKAHLI